MQEVPGIATPKVRHGKAHELIGLGKQPDRCPLAVADGLPHAEEHHLAWLIMAAGTAAGLLGIGLAAVMYLGARKLPAAVGRGLGLPV